MTGIRASYYLQRLTASNTWQDQKDGQKQPREQVGGEVVRIQNEHEWAKHVTMCWP